MLSDWHIGTGAGRPGDVDRLVARDAEGLPFVPAKTAIGIWRDACERLAYGFDDGRAGRWTRWIAILFGSEPGRRDADSWREADAREKPRPATLSVRPARLALPIRERLAALPAPLDKHSNIAEAGIRYRDREKLRAAITFIKPGVMIDPDTGSARDDFLRMEEVARGGVELIADCELDSEGWTEAQQRAGKAILVAGASLIERLGGKRRRGHGRCSARLDGLWDREEALRWLERNDPPNSPSLRGMDIIAASSQDDSGDGWLALPLRLTLETPVVVPAATVGNVVESLDYVPGSFLLPVVAREIRRHGIDAEADIAAGNILVLAATVEIAGQRALPVPMALFTPKGSRPDGHPLGEARNRFVEPDDADAQLQPLRLGYVSLADPGELPEFARVSLRVNTHGTIDDRVQRPTEDVGGVFSYAAIPPGTVLRSEIRLRQGLADRLAAKGAWWQSLARTCRLGRSKKDDYGLVRIELPEGGPSPLTGRWARSGDRAEGTRELKLWLLSDLLMRDDGLRPDATFAAVCRPLSEALPEAGSIRPVAEENGRIGAEVRIRRHDGWQVQWGLPRPTLIGLQAGSCLRVELERPVSRERLAALEVAGLGERRPEGFGQIRINEPLLEEKMKGRLPRQRSSSGLPQPLEPISADGGEHIVAAIIERAAWRAVIMERALAIGLDPKQREAVLGFSSDKPGPSQLGALRSRIARLSGPEPADGPVTRWLNGVEDRRRDKWPASSLRRVRALIADQGEVWNALTVSLEALTADAKTRLQKELWREAMIALIGAGIRGQILDLRSRGGSNA
jgi:CRISPR-associated protein Csx10